MNKKIILLGHGVGVKFTIESLINNPKLGYEVAGVVTHPKEEHAHDHKMMESRKEIYGGYAYNVFNVEDDYGISLLESNNVNSSESIQWIQQFDPAYIISIGCRNIIKALFLNRFENKVLNIHTAPLPKYRGAASDSWMILNGEWDSKQFGCIHFIDTGIDTGNIIAKSHYKIPKFSYPIDVFKIRMNTFKDLLPKAITALQSSDFEGYNQEMDGATVFPRLNTSVDGRIDWSSTGDDILKFIYAFSYPHEGAWCYLDNQKINILESDLLQDIQMHSFATGLIFGKNEIGSYKVAVKGGYLLLRKIEISGKGIQQKKVLRLGRFLK